MTDHTQQPWEPDASKMGNWRAMFEQPRRDGQPPGAPTAAATHPVAPDDAALDGDPDADSTEYRPWIIQRGRSRPAMMLHLRRFEPKSGLWQGWMMAYHSLQAVEYMGDRMLSLDFGTRQFVIEGEGLGQLARLIQEGTVVAIHEYAADFWSQTNEGFFVSAIKRLGIDRKLSLQC